jgi:hypothetical protein
MNNSLIKNNRAIKIQKWWRMHSSIIHLRKIINYLETSLSSDNLQELSNKCESINNSCKGDGSGLLGGCLIDMLVSKFFESKLDKYIEYHNGESDMKILDIPLSQKKINGKSTIALDWSKNSKTFVKTHFNQHIMIINLKTEKWWKTKPIKLNDESKIQYNDIIKSGIYLIDKKYCKKYINLSSNNKTNTLIDSIQLYKMLKRSIATNLFIEIPAPSSKTKLKFNILNGFIEIIDN